MTDQPIDQFPHSEVPTSDDELPQEDQIVYSETTPEDIEQPEEISQEPLPEAAVDDQPSASINDNGSQPPQTDEEDVADVPDEMGARLERLGGEPAPDISPEEFARLQQSGQIHIDPRGRVRSARQHQSHDAGVSLRKRRAWYA